MNTHDVLAFAIAQEAIRRVSAGLTPWNKILTSTSYITASRSWPLPDFVLVDPTTSVTVGVEFKPPLQSKREYLTGLGQAVAYVRDFHYGLLALPTIADDGYPISEHVVSVLAEAAFVNAPVGVLTYDPKIFSPSNPQFVETRFVGTRLTPPTVPASLDQSFFAKWREMGPEEMFWLLSLSYDEVRAHSKGTGTVRDKAFGALWKKIQKGAVHHWAGGIRHYADTSKNKIAVSKNYRNFLFHIGWTENDGRLTREGLEALHVGTLYGSTSQPFLDAAARAVLIGGKHLVLFNAISEFQDSLASVPAQPIWLDKLEKTLEDKGLLKRNPRRHQAAIAGSERQFLKAEKQLWKQLGLIVPYGARVFHPGRGFIFDWARITSLIQGNV